MTQDLYYVESGYLTPDAGYYVYTADAEAAISSQATMTVTAGVIKDAVSTITCQATVAAVISHIHGADLVAFSNAAIATQITVIRGNNVALTSVFSAAIDAVRGIYVTAQADSSANLDISNQRVRFTEAAANAAFALTATVDVIQGGTTQEAAADLTSAASVSVTIDKFVQGNITLASQVSVNISATAGLNGIASIAGEFTSTTDANRIRDFNIVESSAFTPTLSVDVFKNAFAVLDSQSSLTASAVATVSASVSASSQASTTVTTDRFRQAEVTLASQATLAADIVKVIDVTTNATGQFTLTTNISRSRDVSISLTGAFTPTLTADAFKNAFAVLDSQTSLTASAQINKSLAANLSSAFTQTFSGGNAVLATASLISQSTLYANRYVGSGRPVQLTSTDTSFSSTSQYGSHSLSIPGGPSTANIVFTYDNSDLYIPANTDFVFEFWFNLNGGTLLGSQDFFLCGHGDMTSLSAMSANDSWGLGFGGPTGFPRTRLRFKFATANNTFTTIETAEGAYVSGSSSWNQIVVSRRGSTITVSNQTLGKSATGTYSGAIYPAAYKKFRFENGFNYTAGSSTTSLLVDELSLRIGGDSTYYYLGLGFSEPIVNDPDTQVFLYHFNNNLNDDIISTLYANASLSSQFTLTGRITGPVKATASLSSTAGLACQASKSGEINLVAFSNASLSTTGRRVRFADSSQASESTLTTSAGVIKSSGVTLACSVALSADTSRIRSAIASWNALAAELVVADRFAQTSITLSSEFTQTTQAVKTAQVSTTANSAFAQTTVSENSRIIGASADFTTSSTVSVDAYKIKQFASEQSAFFAELAAIVKIGQGLIGLDVSATMTVSAEVTSGSVAYLNSQTQLSVYNARSRLAESSLVVTASLTANASSPKVFSATLAAVSTVTCEISKISGIIALEASSATLTVSAARTRHAEAHLDAFASDLTVGKKQTSAQANLVAQSTMTVEQTRFRLLTFSASLTGFAATVAVIDVVHIDAKLTWMIQADNRTSSIQADTRAYSIQEDDRDYLIVQEVREYAVTRELLTTELQGV